MNWIIKVTAIVVLGTMTMKVTGQPPLVWLTKGKDFHDAIPLGNGDIGISAWVEQDGDLLFYISKTDAYDDNNRLLKLGRIRVKILPNPFVAGKSFRQELDLRRGEMNFLAGEGSDQVNLRLWVDANNPAVQIAISGKKEFSTRVSLEDWRKQQHVISQTPLSVTHFPIQLMVVSQPFLRYNTPTIYWTASQTELSGTIKIFILSGQRY